MITRKAFGTATKADLDKHGAKIEEVIDEAIELAKASGTLPVVVELKRIRKQGHALEHTLAKYRAAGWVAVMQADREHLELS